ncbi:hypothetical protein PTKIN_Ptkin08bG0043200 [Pterospermum kingtungense]
MATMLSHQLISEAFFLLLVVQAIVIVKSESQFPKSLQFLQGAQKGYTFKGLNQVKQYFKAFGYYPNSINNLTDYFDDSLESALETYQQHYRLEVTGRIDSDTIKEMVIPRCGVKDTLRNSNIVHDHHIMFDMVANYTFFDGMPRWNKRQLTYSFRSSAQVVSDRTLKPIMARAFQRWADVSDFTFREAPIFTRADIIIGFHRLFHWDGYPFDGPGNVLAHAFAPQDGRLHYDADENWSTSNSTRINQIDLESIAVHEIGHILGLGHSQDRNAIMFAYYRPGTINRDLGQDDIDGIRALYFDERSLACVAFGVEHKILNKKDGLERRDAAGLLVDLWPKRSTEVCKLMVHSWCLKADWWRLVSGGVAANVRHTHKADAAFFRFGL